MEITDILQVLSNPQAWPLFLAFLGGYVMMNVFLEREKVKKFTELERLLIAFGIGVLFEYFLFYPLVTLASFWWPSFANDNPTFSAILFCAVSGSALLVTIHNETKPKIVHFTKKILTFSTVVLAGIVIFISSVDMGVFTGYQPHTLDLISGSWNTFTSSAIISLAWFVFGVFFVWIYVLKTALNESLDIKFPSPKKHHIPLIAALVIIPLIAGAIVVPIDTSGILFTPRMHTGDQLLSSEMKTNDGFEKVLFISATRGPGNNISTEYHYYALMNTTYNITLPTIWRLLSSVYVDNPSNTSFTMGQYSPSLPSATDSWKLYVAAPDNVTCNPILIQTPAYQTKVTGLKLDFGNFTGNSSFPTTLTYWQEIDPPDDVRIDYANLTFTDLGNGTWTETHTIMITNNSNDTLFIPAMDYDRFNFDYVIKNSTIAYLDGNLMSWTEPVWQTRISLHVWIQPQTVSNLTVSFQTTRNPE
jgi:hypothetical protein